jgi:hypothetical protein
MSEQSTSVIAATTPGFWRRIQLHPAPGRISAGLEDDFHRFLLQVTHADGVITQIETRGERIPWSTCADAGAFLAEQVIGQPLMIVAGLDAHVHCTHLFELLVLCAAHANDSSPTQFDLHVPDRQQGRTCATLRENGCNVLSWQLDGTQIEGPGEWAGRDLRQLSQWKSSLSAADAERAMLLRRVVHISGGRNSQSLNVERASDRGPLRMGACFTYQMPRALDALRTPDWVRDFSQPGAEPLSGFDPDLFNAASGDRT